MSLIETVRRTSLLVAASAILLSGCASLSPQPAGSSMVDFNYAGADAIAAQVGRGSSELGSVLIASLVNVDRLDSSSTFGRISADEVGSRLAQRGFQVLEARMRSTFVVQPSGQFMLSDELKIIAKQQKASSVLVGTYADSGSHVLVSLKLVRVADSLIIGSSDYIVPLDISTHNQLFSEKDISLGASGS